MWWRSILVGLGIIAAWAISGYLINQYSNTDRGTFGDMFGAVNALFTGLAFWAVVVTLWHQQASADAQAKDILEGKKYQRATADALERQAKVLIVSTQLSFLMVEYNQANQQLIEHDRQHSPIPSVIRASLIGRLREVNARILELRKGMFDE